MHLVTPDGKPCTNGLVSRISQSKRNQPIEVKTHRLIRDTPPVGVKMEALHRCFELGEDVQSVSAEIGYSRASIYTWRLKYLREGITALMNPADDPRGILMPGTASSSEEINELKAQVRDMQMQLDILKETINVLKKDPGVDQTAFRSREKVTIIGALKDNTRCRIYWLLYTVPAAAIITNNRPRSSKINTVPQGKGYRLYLRKIIGVMGI